MRDLIMLVADKNTEFTIHGGLGRPTALSVRPVDYHILVHPERDGGVRRTGVQLLRLQRRQFGHALLLFDYEGSGASVAADELEAALTAELRTTWGDNGRAIVVRPEVDVWMWGADVHLQRVVGWSFADGVRDWLVSSGFLFDHTGKPQRPKEALEAVFRRAQTRRSSACYKTLASMQSLSRCEDASFLKLRAILQLWFPPV